MYQNIVEQADYLIAIIQDGLIRYVNRRSLEVLGYLPEEIVGTNFNRYVHSEEFDRKRTTAIGCAPYRCRIALKHRNGSRLDVETRGSLMKYENRPAEVFIIRDITDHKQTEEELQKSEERRNTFMNSTTDIIYLLDSELNFIDINRRGLEFAGKDRNEIIGKNLIDINPVVKESGRYDRYIEVMKTGKPYEIEDIIQHPIFGDLHINFKAFRVGDGVGVIAEEVTDIVHLRGKIESSMKEKEILLREVHDRVKNNMQIISSLMNLQSRQVKDENSLKLFRDCQNRIYSMALVHEKMYQFQDMGIIDSTKYIECLTRALFRLYKIDPLVVALKIATNGICLGVDDAIPCALIINELVSNSLKHAFQEGERGEISIEFDHYNRDSYILIVSDDGRGLPADLDFQNAESLGLLLVNILTKQLGGVVELDRANRAKYTIIFPKRIRVNSGWNEV